MQHLQLVHAASRPEILDQNTSGALAKLVAAGLIAPGPAETLRLAAYRLNSLTQVLRLSLVDAFDPATAPDGLKRLLCQVGDAPTVEILAADLQTMQKNVAGLFDELVV